MFVFVTDFYISAHLQSCFSLFCKERSWKASSWLIVKCCTCALLLCGREREKKQYNLRSVLSIIHYTSSFVLLFILLLLESICKSHEKRHTCNFGVGFTSTWFRLFKPITQPLLFVVRILVWTNSFYFSLGFISRLFY